MRKAQQQALHGLQRLQLCFPRLSCIISFLQENVESIVFFFVQLWLQYCNIVPCQSALLCPSSFVLCPLSSFKFSGMDTPYRRKASGLLLLIFKMTQYIRHVRRKHWYLQALKEQYYELHGLMLSSLPASCCRSRAEGWSLCYILLVFVSVHNPLPNL